MSFYATLDDSLCEIMLKCYHNIKEEGRYI